MEDIDVRHCWHDMVQCGDNTLHFSTLQYSTVHFTSLQYTTVQYSTLHFTTLTYFTVKITMHTLHTILQHQFITDHFSHETIFYCTSDCCMYFITLHITILHFCTSNHLTCPKQLTTSDKAKNHSTQDSRVVPHRGTDWAALWLTAQIRRDAVLSESYGRGWVEVYYSPYKLMLMPVQE